MTALRLALTKAGYVETTGVAQQDWVDFEGKPDPERVMSQSYAAEEWLEQAQMDATHGG